MVGQKKNLLNVGSQKPRKSYLMMVFANASFNYTLFQLIFKYDVASTLQTLPDFRHAVVALFYLNFLKFQKLGMLLPPNAPPFATSLLTKSKNEANAYHNTHKKHGLHMRNVPFALKN